MCIFILLTSVPIAPVLTTEVLRVHLARYPVKPVVISLISRFDSDNAHSTLFLSLKFKQISFFFLCFFFIFFSFHSTILILSFYYVHFHSSDFSTNSTCSDYRSAACSSSSVPG